MGFLTPTGELLYTAPLMQNYYVRCDCCGESVGPLTSDRIPPGFLPSGWSCRGSAVHLCRECGAKKEVQLLPDRGGYTMCTKTGDNLDGEGGDSVCMDIGEDGA